MIVVVVVLVVAAAVVPKTKHHEVAAAAYKKAKLQALAVADAGIPDMTGNGSLLVVLGAR